MRPWIGKYIAGVGLIHSLFGLVVFRAVFADIVCDRLFNTVGWQLDRGFAYWFVMTGFFWMLLGAVVDHFEKAGHPLPRFLGPAFGAVTLASVVLMPLSGWWLFFVPAVALVSRGTSQPK